MRRSSPNYWIADDELLITVVEGTKCEATPTQVPPAALAMLKSLAAHLRSAGKGGWTLVESEVAGLDLLAPALLPDIALGALSRRRKLFILPHRALHAVPFSLLRVEGGRLGLRFPYSFIPCLAALGRSVPVAPERGAAAVGIGVYSGGLNQLADFPVAAKAVVARQHEAGLPAKLIEDNDRARTGFLDFAETGDLKRCGFLLLACHGTSVMGNEPDRSFLLMGADRLDAGTLARLPLRADLVMMAACCSGQRAVGGRDLDVWPGDDLFGLQAALCKAGARQVIGSLWNADGPAAAEMATAVHAAWLAGADAAGAVHVGATGLARSGLRVRTRDWAPFVAMTFGRVAVVTE